MLRCPISGAHPMSDPVLLPDGCTYERSAAEAYLAGGARVSPKTGQPFPTGRGNGGGSGNMVENKVVRMMCVEWREIAAAAPAPGGAGNGASRR